MNPRIYPITRNDRFVDTGNRRERRRYLSNLPPNRLVWTTVSIKAGTYKER